MKVIRAVWVGLIVTLFMTSGCRLAKNLHVVENGKLYRSAQLTKEEFATAFHALNIKTVINLRGERPNEGWYQDEVQVTQEFGVKLINIGMSASRIPHKKDLITLLESYENVERPILIHCKAGADRTGEAAAIYQMLYMGIPKKKAMRSLSLKYLHVRKATPAKSYFIKIFEGVDWAFNTYDPCSGIYKHYNPLNPNCTGSAEPEVWTEDDDT